MKLFDNEAEEEHLWKVRESGLGATARIPGEKDAWEGWEDSAVPPDRVGPYLRDLRKLLQKYGYGCSLYGHFGQGCIHTRIDFELKTYEGVKHFRKFLDEAGDLVVSYGGSISGEHGDGQSKAALLPKMFGPELVRAFGEFKAIFDPDNKMNPHKVVDPYLPGENLRLGPAYNPPQVETHFKFLDDKGSFAYATERCVGIGECRKEEAGTMCPSYMVTKEEMDSTRGRAHLLFEMLQGDPMKGGWKSETVQGVARPLPGLQGMPHRVPDERGHGHVQGRVPLALLRGAAPAPARLRDGPDLLVGAARLAGARGGQPRHARAGRRQAVPDARRDLDPAHDAVVRARDVQGVVAPPCAAESWAVPRVILWPDTFNNHFHPQTAKAAVEVLEDAGFQVVVPRKSLCCGRPLYDFGMLDTAKGLLREILDTLRPEIEAGTPVVGLEPSCVAVFRDELINLFPMDEDAKRLSSQHASSSASSSRRRRPHYRLPQLKRKALVQKHCHHEHVMKFDAENSVLKKLGLDYELLDSGCCGMAGSFGFESGHYDVSVAVGERVLLPAVRGRTQTR